MASLILLGLAWSLVMAVGFVKVASHNGAILSDFTVFWTAARSKHVYDAAAFTSEQQWLLPPIHGLRPFPYPPTAILFLAPLQWLDYYPAAALWSVLSIASFVGSALLYGRRALLGLLCPMVTMAVAAGQMSLILGSGIAAGIAMIRTRPIVAGCLFGIVAAIKPQIAVLIPVALVAAGQWRVLMAAVCAGASVVGASLLLGPTLWTEWLHSLPTFLNQIVNSKYQNMNMSPGIWFAPLGILSVIYVFRKTSELEFRLITLVSGSCLCVPYMMNYDLAAMAGAAAVLTLSGNVALVLVGLVAFVSPWSAPFAGLALVLASRVLDTALLRFGLANGEVQHEPGGERDRRPVDNESQAGQHGSKYD
jgi:hypothetical protein